MTQTNIPEKGAIVQRDLMTFSISPHIPGGFADPALLRKIADVAEKYGAKFIKLTGAQRIAIIGISEADLDNAWSEFTDSSKAIGLTIRSIQMCPGTRACKKAKQDSPGLGLALDKEFYGKPAPAKFKMGVSGCSNCCSDSWMKDIGFFGTDTGFNVIVGGKGGGTPKAGKELANDLTPDQAIDLARKIITFYRENGIAPERLGATIERLGFDTFRKAVL
ncbi:nitrite/sulfite reductase domain-containing protein [Methanospirillum lacunae]|uniref:NAD(P)/FAD-dependent oxidoreductase n=1 Tax=Methanospirillum lacunae TaxID=668570 RepID=A0A2V2NCW8_9EURY|nr:NAD(P)/FAD-dependent oxidoreductase [Methanospirillum lacunae]PWR74258.1 NAD(P)/FAD-dependent oxidoreductase [Methanospirillum lacunae]